MYEQTVRDGLSKVSNVNLDNIPSTQLALLVEMCGIGVSSFFRVINNTSRLLISAFGASDFRTTTFSETFEHVSFTKATEE